jgi:hypothetical protein
VNRNKEEDDKGVRRKKKETDEEKGHQWERLEIFDAQLPVLNTTSTDHSSLPFT